VGALRSQLRPQVGREPQQIRKHPARGDLRSRTRALHDERIVAVAARRKADYVIGESDVGEWVLRLELAQADGGLARRRERAGVAQYLAALACGREADRKSVV